MAAEDYIDFDYFDDRQNEDGVTCARCGVCFLEWQWSRKYKRCRLHEDGGELHVCEVKPEDDFEDLGEL